MSDKPTYEEAVFPVQSPRHTAFKIAFIYASISVIWILFSDQLLSIFVKDIETITRIQMVKGWFFVLATSYLIFFLLQKDIKKYCQVEEALRHSQEQLLSLMDAMPIALSWSDEQGNIQYSNNKFRELFGYALEDMPTVEQWFQLAYPDQEYRQTVVANWQIAVENAQNSGAEIAPIEVTIACKDGSTRYVAVVGTLLHDRILAVFNDLTESKRAEDALKESEKKYRQLVESTNDWVWSCDLNGIHIFSNQAIKSFLGYEPHEIIGKSAFKFMHPEGRNWVQKMVQQATKQKKGWQVENIRWRHKDGSVRHVESRAEPILDAEGNIDGFSGIGRDITERKQAEKALRKSEEMYHSLFENTGTATFVVEEDMTISQINAKCEELIGYTRDEIEGKMKTPDFVSVKDIERIKKYHFGRREQDGDYPSQYELTLIDKHGDTRNAIIQVGMIPGTKRTIASIIDITPLRQAQEELRTSEERFRSMVSNIPGVVYRCLNDPYWTVIYISDFIERLSGYPASEFDRNQVRSYASIIHPDDRPLVEKSVQESLDRAETFSLEYRIVDVEGKIHWVYEQGKGTLGNNGEVKYLDGAIFDITERKLAEEALRESETTLKSIFRAAPIGIGMVCNRVIMKVNDRFCDILGYSNEELIGQSARIIYQTEKEYGLVGREKYRQISKRGTGTVETRFKRKDGIIIDVLLSSTPLDISDLSKGVTFTILDITERKQAEEGLRESERRYRALFESANDAIFIMKGDKFLECNPKTLEMFGCTYEQIIGKQPFAFSPPNQPDSSDSLEKVLEKVRISFEKESQVFEWRHTKYDGTPFDAQVSLNVVELKTGTHLQAIVRDITERKRAEQDLKESESQLRSLAHRLQEVEEAERKALARELHDSVGQNMTALNINLNILQTQLPLELLEKEGPRLEDSMNLVDETTEHIRDVMAELRPSVLDDYGLVAALRWYGKRFSERTGVSVQLHEDETLSRLPETVESAFFRIAQEALTNVSKHADATEVALSFEEIDGMLRLVIADNGKGFDPMAASKSGDRKGWGILNMQERAQTLGGQVQVESQPGRGTKILIEMRK